MHAIITEHYENNFNTLVKRFSYRAGTMWDAEDALHDAYERAIKYFPSFDPDKSTFDRWFSRIAVNAVKEHYAKNHGKNDLEFDEDLVDGIPCQQYTDKMNEEILLRIKEKTPFMQEILTLFFEKGYGAKDIARLVETTHYGVNIAIHRFRDELRRDYK